MFTTYYFFFAVSLLISPNFIPQNDPDYQLKFFSQRVFSGFFDGTGSMDALSDIVLGIQLIQQNDIKLLVIGILLFILSNVDYFQVMRRAVTPQKIKIFETLFVVFVEMIVLVLTCVVLFDVSKTSQGKENQDAFYVIVFSLATSIVNFCHNLVALWQKFTSQYNLGF
eukprot:TRINITY_DN7079_c0_g1_i1.p3 TRINITY_DN7079_c0_g1~~TRINITY_DN7079_c0_g1_i1.p3  ORF type:complete len:168 (+),score=25.19 TRINITY_DN7079_c0_g1_i1:91-594(+)